MSKYCDQGCSRLLFNPSSTVETQVMTLAAGLQATFMLRSQLNGDRLLKGLALGILCLVAAGCEQGFAGGRISTTPADQEMIVSMSRMGATSLYAFDRNGTDGVRLTTGTDDWSPSVSPDGTLVAFLRREPGGACDVWLLDRKSGQERPLTRTIANEGLIVFSPDGSRLWLGRAQTLRTTSTLGHRWVDWGIFEITLATGTERRIGDRSFTGLNALDSSRVRPDLLVSVNELETGSRVYRMDVSTGALEAVGQPGDTSAAYISDGTAIVVIRRVGSSNPFVYELFVSTADGSGWRQITQTGSYNMTPMPLRDGRSILYLSDPERDGRFELIETDIVGSKAKRVKLTLRARQS
jgi:Tol biopolymer transport system component